MQAAMRAQEYEDTRTDPAPTPKNIKPTNFKGIKEGIGRIGEGPRKKNDIKRHKRPVTQTVQGWMYESVTRPLRMLLMVYVAEKARKQKPTEDAVKPKEDKCSSRRGKVKPKEEKAAVEVVRRAVRKKGEEKSGRAGGRAEVRCFSAACVRAPIRGRESIPVENMAAPQTQKGRRNPEIVYMKEP